MKKIIDRIARRIFTISGFTTSIAILLIIGFLFSEAVGLFSNPVVDKGYVLALNQDNPVKRLRHRKSNSYSMKKLRTGKSWEDKIFL